MDAASIAIASAALAVSCIALLATLLQRRSKASEARARGIALPSRRFRRIKRYVLVKVVCLDGEPEPLVRELTQRVYSVLGPALMARCGLALVAYRKDLGRAIIRVSGDPQCVKHVLMALSMMHVLEKSKCLAVPLRASGCLTRLRKALRVYRA